MVALVVERMNWSHYHDLRCLLGYNLNLSNPKRFLPLLLFIGFVFVLIGIGFWTFTQNNGFIILGMLLIFLSVIIYVRSG